MSDLQEKDPWKGKVGRVQEGLRNLATEGSRSSLASILLLVASMAKFGGKLTVANDCGGLRVWGYIALQ